MIRDYTKITSNNKAVISVGTKGVTIKVDSVTIKFDEDILLWLYDTLHDVITDKKLTDKTAHYAGFSRRKKEISLINFIRKWR